MECDIGQVVELSSYHDGKVGFVRLQTDQGVVGWGQFGGKDVDITVELFHRRVAPAVIFRHIHDFRRITEIVLYFELNYKMMGVQLSKAIAGLDSAAWDAAAKMQKTSVCGLLGSNLQPHPVYASSISRKIQPETLAEKLKQLNRKHGVEAFKVKVGKRMGKDEDEWPGRSKKVIDSCREALGGSVKLAVDANGAYDTVSHALDEATWLEEREIWFLEEPFPWFLYDKYLAFKPRAVVAGGEQEFRIDVWERMIKDKPFEIVQPDFGYAGGFSQVLKIVELAEQHGLKAMPHSPQADLSPVMALHLACAKPTTISHVEFACVDDGIAHTSLDANGVGQSSYFASYVQLRDGKLSLVDANDGLGWGVQLSRKWLDNAVHQEYKAETSDTMRSGL